MRSSPGADDLMMLVWGVNDKKTDNSNRRSLRDDNKRTNNGVIGQLRAKLLDVDTCQSHFLEAAD
jgi:hypothetical protein